nr:hypothetical protein GCM10020185_02870 [Pseudomonas brassicacearum subsp. brassicacearum]
MAGHMAEGFVHLHQAQRRGQHRLDGATAVHQLAAVFAVQPAPQRVLGRGVVHAYAGQRWEGSQAFDLGAQRLDQRFAKTDHGPPIDQQQEFVYRSRQCLDRFQGKNK